MNDYEKLQIAFVGNVVLPGFLGTIVAGDIIKTRPYGMVIGTIILYIYIRYIGNDKDCAKATYRGAKIMFLLQGIPLFHVIIGAIGVSLVGMLDSLKTIDDGKSGLRWEFVGNIQLLLLTLFCGFVIISVSSWIGYKLTDTNSD